MYLLTNTSNFSKMLQIFEIFKFLENLLTKSFGQNVAFSARPAWSHMVSVEEEFAANYSIPTAAEERLSQIWQKNVYISSSIESVDSLSNHRPLLLTMSGETFDAWRILKNRNMHGQGTDVHIQRTHSWPRPGCIVTAYIQGILQRDLHFERNWGPHTDDVWNLMNYDRLITDYGDDDGLRQQAVERAFAEKERFCSLTTKNIMIYSKYFADALVRHSFNVMISEQYKRCDLLGLYHDKDTPKNVLCNDNNPKYKVWSLSLCQRVMTGDFGRECHDLEMFSEEVVSNKFFGDLKDVGDF